MKLHPGKKAEYKKRHDEIWPELKALLKESGVEDYSIFLDEETSTLFGVLTITDSAAMEALPANPVMKRWWDFMKDLMPTNADNSPETMILEQVFYMK